MRQSIAAIALALVSAACGGGSNPLSPEPGTSGNTGSSLPATAAFSQSPIDVSVISTITPIGNLNPPDHTLPTNHAYFFHPSQANAEVRAPAAGIVRIVSRGNDDQITISASTQVQYYLAHILLDAGIAQNQQVTAGQRLGVTASAASAMDLGVINNAVTLLFARPERYIPATLHADSPLKYFDEPVRSQLYAKVSARNPDGRIDFDQVGRLAGNWFVADLAPAATETFGNGPRQLAFVRDVQNPDLLRISIGGTLPVTGAFYVQTNGPDPANISTDTGRVGFGLLLDLGATQTRGTLMVEMTAADRMRAQVFPAGTPLTAEFTDAAVVYVR